MLRRRIPFGLLGACRAPPPSACSAPPVHDGQHQLGTPVAACITQRRGLQHQYRAPPSLGSVPPSSSPPSFRGSTALPQQQQPPAVRPPAPSGTSASPATTNSSSSSNSPYPFFRLGAVTDGAAFIATTRKQARALQRYDMAMRRKKSAMQQQQQSGGGGVSPQGNSNVLLYEGPLDLEDPEWAPLTSHFTIPMLEYEVWEKRGLKTDMLSTLLIPYDTARELILAALPERYRVLAEQELAYEESVLVANDAIRKAKKEIAAANTAKAKGANTIMLNNIPSATASSSSSSSTFGSVEAGDGSRTSILTEEQQRMQRLEAQAAQPLRPVPTSTILQYKDDDVYGTAPIMKAGPYARNPVVCVMGHIDHGKTTLLDSLMASNMCAREAGLITQSVRCFTVDMKTCVGQLEGLKRRNAAKKMAAMGAVVSDDNSAPSAAVVPVAGVGASTDGTATPPPLPTASLFDTISPARYATYPSSITFVDTPGHKAFAEMRFHSQLAADCITLIIALDEGIKGQTLEVLHVALNMDRPIVVAFNKTDKFTDPRLLAAAIVGAVQALAKEGLKVKLVSSFEELDALRKPSSSSSAAFAAASSASSSTASLLSYGSVESQQLSHSPIAPYLAKRSQLAEAKQQSASSSSSKKKGKKGSSSSAAKGATANADASILLMNPVLESGKLQRRALAVCLSGKSGANVDLLLEVLRTAGQLLHPVADAGLGTKVQAQVLEASKTTEQTEQRELHGKFGESSRADASNFSASSSDLQKEMAAQGTNGSFMATAAANRALRGFSTTNMIITAVVRSGILKLGMPFVADQCVGTIRRLTDYWGRPIKFAMPGTAVVIIDDRSASGCPGVGTHVIGVPTVERAKAVNQLRKEIAWFVEAFPKRTALMRPKGLDTSFKAVGNFGQLDQKESEKSLQYRLLYGGGGAQGNEKDGASGSSSSAEADAATKDNKAAESVGPSSVVEGTPAEVESRWSALQLEKMPETKEEMEELQKNGKMVGVYCKVDSWHSARILQREIPRLSTKHIFFSVLGIKFGELKSDDTQDFINNSRVVICYRTPRLKCPKTFRHLELFNFHFLETDIYSDVVTYLKTVAIDEHERFIKERGSLESKRNHEATKALLEGIGISEKVGRKRGLQALTRPLSTGPKE